MEREIELERTGNACPGCNTPMHDVPQTAGRVLACFTCGGAWIDSTAAWQIIDGDVTDVLSAVLALLPQVAAQAKRHTDDYRSNANHGRQCLACKERLIARPLGHPPVEVDVCAHHGTYFDAAEIAKLLQMPSARKLQREMESVRDAAARDDVQIVGDMVMKLVQGISPSTIKITPK